MLLVIIDAASRLQRAKSWSSAEEPGKREEKRTSKKPRLVRRSWNLSLESAIRLHPNLVEPIHTPQLLDFGGTCG